MDRNVRRDVRREDAKVAGREMISLNISWLSFWNKELLETETDECAIGINISLSFKPGSLLILSACTFILGIYCFSGFHQGEYILLQNLI